MNTNTFAYAVKIYLDSAPSIPNKSDIGLFDDLENGSNFVFRWSTIDLNTDYLPTWLFKPGIVSLDGIADIVESLPDPFNGGDLAGYNNASVSVLNTLTIGGTAQPFDKYLDTYDIYLSNLICEVIYFEFASSAIVYPDGVSIFRGKIDTISLNETSMTLSLKDPYSARSVPTHTSINETNVEISATLGTFNLNYNSSGVLEHGGAARVTRTEDTVDQWKIESQIIGNDFLPTRDIYLAPYNSKGENLKVFPVIWTENVAVPEFYGVRLTPDCLYWTYSDGSVAPTKFWDLTTLEGKILTVVDGTGKGQSTVITSAKGGTYIPPDAGARTDIEIYIAPFFKTTLEASLDFTSETMSWVTISGQENEYLVDIWPCKSFIDISGADVDNNIPLYSYDNVLVLDVEGEIVDSGDKDFINIPSLNVVPNSDTNGFKLPSGIFNSQANSSLNYILTKPSEVSLVSLDSAAISVGGRSNELSIFTGNTKWDSSTTEIYPGHFLRNTNSSDTDTIIGSIVGTPANTTIPVSTTSYSYRYTHPTDTTILDHDLIAAYEIKLPELNANNNFNNVYLGVRINSEKSTTATTSDIKMNVQAVVRRFIGPNQSEKTISLSLKKADNSIHTAMAYNLPDSYYTDSPATTEDLYFIYENENWESSFGNTASGVEFFDLSPLTDVESFNSQKSVYLFVEIENLVDGLYVDVNINDIVLVFKKGSPIKETMYTTLKGRIFNDTWGGRKTATDQIITPMDMIEHLKRIGNWKEVGDTNEFGQEYAPNALINTTAFDNVELSHLLSSTPALQMSGTINNLVRAICKDYWLNSYIDSSTGDEVITPVAKKATTTPTLTITYSDIIGEIGYIKYNDTSKVITQPSIKYAYNNAKQDYDKILSIKNTNQSSFDSSYVTIITGAQAELLWTFGKVLFDVTKTVQDPTDRMVECRSIVSDEDAIYYLTKMYELMGVVTTDGTASGVVYDPKQALTFNISLITGIDFKKGEHFNLVLPHQTDNITVECEILYIKKSLSSGLVELKILLLGYVDGINYSIQEVTNTTNPVWNETTDDYSVHGEGNNINEDT